MSVSFGITRLPPEDFRAYVIACSGRVTGFGLRSFTNYKIQLLFLD
jgi:hypothetical protein